MGLKKYEIITVGSDKRVRALRSWQVGDRYVNIGDVGGIVYDEKTLSQDGACWLFKGNFGFPGARISGDSIVDVGEMGLSGTGAPNVDILGSSVVVGSNIQLAAGQTAADAVVLTADDFEQGTLTFNPGSNWETWKSNSPQYLRVKAPIFTGGAPKIFKLEVPGYTVQAYMLTREGLGVSATAGVTTGPGVTLTVLAAQYCLLRLNKVPLANIVPADATAAQITFTGTYETKLSIIDSRVEINPANGTGTITIRPGGAYSPIPGSKYPDTVIQGSKVVINSHATANRMVRLISEFIGCNVAIDATSGDSQGVGVYSSVNNLTFTGTTSPSLDEAARSSIQAYDCDNFAVSPTIFPGLAAMQTAGVPIRFYNCNQNNGRFYHHAQIANTYRDINFNLATADLGKTFSTDRTLGSSEVNGMYRAVLNGVPGPLIESYASVKDLVVTQNQKMYDTTIYADVYLNGAFDIQGTNVFGHKVRSHPLAQVLNVQPRVVQGNFNSTAVGGTITRVVTTPLFVSTPVPFRINSAKGLTINNLPAGCVALMFMTGANNVITRLQSTTVANTDLMAAGLADVKVFIRFGKSDSSPITPEDLAGVTVTTYNGCKLVNTKETAATIAGNVRVEGNATLIDTGVTGTGYFGGNCVASGMVVNGCAFMDDNAILVKTSEGGSIRRLYMRDNSYAKISVDAIFGLLDLRDNAIFSPEVYGTSEADVIMRDNAIITSRIIANGVITMKDNAKVSGGTVTIFGDITLCGSYNQTASKVWTGKRTITDVNEPTYDNNVKTQYDF